MVMCHSLLDRSASDRSSALSAMSRGGSYTQMYEAELHNTKVLHLKDGVAKAARKQHQQHQHANGAASTSHSQAATPRGQPQQRQQQQYQQYENERSQPNDDYHHHNRQPSHSHSHSQQHEHQEQQQSQQQRPSTAQPALASSSSSSAPAAAPRDPSAPPATWIAGFSSMDRGPKTAAGSGGEKTLRHRMFPFHDLPLDGDPHRSMFRAAAGSAPSAEEVARRQTGSNVINHAYVANPAAYAHPPPPPRPRSEFDKLMQPEVFRDEKVDHKEWSTKHRPKHQLPNAERGLTAEELRPSTAAPASSSSSGRSGPHTSQRVPHSFDPSRAGRHSSLDILAGGGGNAAPPRRGVKMVHHPWYTSARDFHAESTQDGKMVPSEAERSQLASALAGRGSAEDQAREHAQRQQRDAGAGVRIERRPGSKSIAPQTISLRQSNQVAALLSGSAAAAAAPAAPTSGAQFEALAQAKPLRLNHAMRERDWGQHHTGYDIITLAGAGGQDGRGAVTERAAQVAARESTQGLGPSHVGGVTNRKMIGAVTGGHGGAYAPNHVSHLTNHFTEVAPAAQQQQQQPHYRASNANNNSSDAMWSMLQGRPL